MKKTIALFGLMLAALPAGGSAPLKLSVTPAHAFAPATLRIRATVEPNAANRKLAVIADGVNFYRSSEIPLDGEQAPKMVETRFADLPDGEYDISAVLTDLSGHARAIAHQSVRVMEALSH